MVQLNHAYTSSINPPSVQPVLTIPQVWAGLERKVRAGQDFVPVIVSTDVIQEKMDESTGIPVCIREVVFKEGNRKVKEICHLHKASRVDFLQPDGSTISNIISEGSGGVENNDLNMTYSFEWQHPEIEATDEHKIAEMMTKYKGMAKMAVETTITNIRQMVVDGRIKA